MKTAAHPLDQNFDALPCCDESSDQGFPYLEWPLGNLDVLPRFERLVDLHNFICVCPVSNFADQCIRQKRKTIPELHEAANTGFLSNSTIEGGIIKSSKEVPWKHGLYEPDGATICTLPQTHSRAENLHFGDLPQASCCDMFPFGLGPQTEP